MKKYAKVSAFSLIEISIVMLIVGILIAGVSQGSKLVSKFRLSTAQSLTESSPVASISGLYYWFESTSDKSFIESEKVDGGLISTWYDINPQNVNRTYLTQSTDHQPQYKEKSDLNGLPAVYFSGDDKYIDAGENESLTYENATLIVVAKANFIPSENHSGTETIAMLAPYGYCAFFTRNTDGNQTYHFVGSAYNVYGTGSRVIVENRKEEAEVFILEQNNSVPYTFRAWLSGEYKGSVHDLRCDPGYLILGATQGNTLHGQIGEVIVYNKVLSEEERKSIEKYLAQKWNIKLAI